MHIVCICKNIISTINNYIFGLIKFIVRERERESISLKEIKLFVYHYAYYISTIIISSFN